MDYITQIDHDAARGWRQTAIETSTLQQRNADLVSEVKALRNRAVAQDNIIEAQHDTMKVLHARANSGWTAFYVLLAVDALVASVWGLSRLPW